VGETVRFSIRVNANDPALKAGTWPYRISRDDAENVEKGSCVPVQGTGVVAYTFPAQAA